MLVSNDVYIQLSKHVALRPALEYFKIMVLLSLADDFWEWVYEIISAAGNFLVILKPGMRFSKGKSIIWRSDFSKISRSIFRKLMLSLKVNSISTYSAGNAVSKGKRDICEWPILGGKLARGRENILQFRMPL